MREIVVDNFAGGGASTGIEIALVRANLPEICEEKILKEGA